MSINFDALPQENPFALQEPGLYKMKIEEAVMKSGSDITKPPYLNLKLALFDHDDNSKGAIYDMIAESDSSFLQYKLSRFVRACGIPLTGQMELSDLAHIVSGKVIAGDVNHSKATEKYAAKAQIDIFTRGAYYTLEEYEDEYLKLHPTEADSDFEPEQDVVPQEFTVTDGADKPFDAPDGDAPATGTAEY